MPKGNLSSQLTLPRLLYILSGVIFSFILYLPVITGLLKKGVYTLLILAIILFLFYLSRIKIKRQTNIQYIITGVLVFLVLRFLYDLALTYFKINVWDFYCFYLFGKVGISSPDFYNPAVFMHYYQELNLESRASASFISEVVNVGFWYPPPSMFIFLPLGLFDLQTGFFIWQTLIIGFLIAGIILLIKKYTSPENKNHIGLFIPLLILLFPGITDSIPFSQIVSVFFFFLVLLIKYFENWKAGPVLAILIIIKPLAAVFVLYFILFKKWKAVISFIISGVIILLLTVGFFGYNSLLNFFISPPTNRIPAFVYYENQSLYGTLLKIQQKIPDYISIHSIKLLSYSLCLVIIGITVYFSGKLKKISPVHPLMAYIPLALLVYPATLDHYKIMALPVALYIFTQKPSHNHILNLIIMFFIYAAGFYSCFLLNLILWIIITGWPLVMRYTGPQKTPAIAMQM